MPVRDCLMCGREWTFKLDKTQFCDRCAVQLERLGVDLDEAERRLKEPQ